MSSGPTWTKRMTCLLMLRGRILNIKLVSEKTRAQNSEVRQGVAAKRSSIYRETGEKWFIGSVSRMRFILNTTEGRPVWVGCWFFFVDQQWT